MGLAQKKCAPCEVGGSPLPAEDARRLAKGVPGWTLGEKAIEREFKFKDFKGAMEFVNKVADIANEQDHHPDIYISYNMVRLTLSTHKVGGLSANDFILAAKINQPTEGK